MPITVHLSKIVLIMLSISEEKVPI